MYGDNSGIKRNIIKENTLSLGHKRLAHIFLERIKMLVNNDTLKDVNFADFDICLSCIKEKQTNKFSKDAKRNSNIFEIIHTDICGLFSRYFILFIGDYTKYIYLYLLFEKNEALGGFKFYKVEVEKQLDKK